ncbi:Dna2/Cas4 domain-containing protein [Saccharopolyspora gregorii]|uniref:DUF83 domain-containing protein n=1 Tax=Saccharopolyspora gregorii TaxID=33914 RepID=A0ABP6RNF3_9PSEU
MIGYDDIGGVHIKYLYHCRRQLWLYTRGFRPEHLNDSVAAGSAMHDTSYSRFAPIDLGAARLDHLDGQAWVHEAKNSRTASDADHAQARHYCHQVRRIGVDVQGAIVHYRPTKRTVRHPYTDDEHTQAEHDIQAALDVITADQAPSRLARSRCFGCAYSDYCWNA